MDQGSVGLVVGLLDERIRAIRRSQPEAASGRGRQLVDLIAAMLVGVEEERDRILANLSSASGDEAAVLGRKLLRLLTQVRGFTTLTPFLRDVGRTDLPIGIVQAIDILIDALLLQGADPVIHLDEHHMYSTLDLLSLTQSVRASLGVTFTPDPAPVVFFLPSTDPSNALLLPILAHEVGHTAVDQSALVTEVFKRADLTALNDLFDECFKASGSTDPAPWHITLFHWMEELICDGLAAALTGPSFLFAAAVFLPAPDEGSLGTHPFPSDRIGFTLRTLDKLGWKPLLDSHSQGIVKWLEGLDQPIDTTVPLERFLREGTRILEPAILAVSDKHVRGKLIPSDFDDVQSFLEELLHAGIPPAEIGNNPTPPWISVLAAWLHRIRAEGDEPSTLVSVVADVDFNATILKSIEMSRILDLWRTT